MVDGFPQPPAPLELPASESRPGGGGLGGMYGIHERIREFRLERERARQREVLLLSLFVAYLARINTTYLISFRKFKIQNSKFATKNVSRNSQH